MIRFVACVAAIVSVSAPTLAQEKCWTSKEMAAARVRDLQSVLMVGALQCRTSGHDVLSGFNKFVVAGRATIVAKNDVLKARFVRLQGVKEGNRAYDAFTTALANAHALSGSVGGDFCKSMAAMADEATAAASGGQASDALELIAERLGERPQGVGEACSDTKVASSTTTKTTTKTTTAPSVFTMGQTGNR